ncbi:MAG: arginine--tRNA ligase [Acidobacteria bacterium]|nr:arginine--tRNA ligase [Acidobacteriota bacterium]
MILEQITDQLSDAIKARVLTLFGIPIDRVVLQAPPRLAMGDLATPVAMELAKQARKAPRQIAEAIASGLELPVAVSRVSVEGAGYLNFHFDRRLFTLEFLRAIGAPPSATGHRVTVEHTNINPNKAAHIGHLRNAVLGDTLIRCLVALGNHVERQNYIDDTGVQVADVVVGFERLLGEGIAEVEKRIADPSVRFDYFCWDLYARTGQHYEKHPEAIEWRKETLHRIEKGEGETARLGAIVAKAIVTRHLETALRLGIEYDVLVKESDIIRQRFWDRAFELLKTSGSVVFEEEGKHKGCWVMKLADSAEFEGMEEPDKILVRSNGTVTYVGKDIAYQLWKFGLIGDTFAYREFRRYDDGRIVWETTSEGDGIEGAPHFGGAQSVYNVIDVRQGYLQKIVKEGLRILGHQTESERSIHFSYEMVALSPATAKALGVDVKPEDEQKAYLEMSGRKGLGVKADDMLDELEAKAREKISSERSTGSEADDAKLARQIAIAALRYFMLKYGRTKVIAFDVNEALSFEGDSGPYLQYSTVRVGNIFRKMEERGVDPMLGKSQLDRLAIGEELVDDMWQIVRMSADTDNVIRRAVETLELSLVTRHAFDLAQTFNSFYHKFPILNEKDDAERQRRAVVAEVFRRTMNQIFDLVGIPMPDRM